MDETGGARGPRLFERREEEGQTSGTTAIVERAKLSESLPMPLKAMRLPATFPPFRSGERGRSEKLISPGLASGTEKL